ncbi:MAG: hypothetical protein QN194_15540 [Armatimonadota bacterium]|nr:hypothetical protein [Armatimonadota bacterium]
MMLLALSLALLAPLAQAGSDGQIPPFDPGQATYDPALGAWCDPNWCVYDPNGVMGWIYATPACPVGSLCGWGRWDAADPDVVAWMIASMSNFFCEYLACVVPIELRATACQSGHPLCSIPTAGDGGSNGGGGGGGRGGGGGSADSCPAPEVVRAPPQIEPLIASPPYPVVAGQDPERKGVIYELTVRVPPVVYRRWEREPDRCEPVPDADGDGKPDRGGNCRTTIGDPPAAWPGDLKPGGCRLIEETYPDPIAGDGLLTMVLSPSSRAWIQGELAAKYPGARVRMPEIRMPIHGQGQVMGDKTFLFTAKVNPKPVDPGVYEVEFFFRTAGTPVSDPIVVRRRIEQKVWLMESAITR